jgi:hypothetical protein
MAQQLRDPWGILVAVLFGGLAGAVAAAGGSSTVVTVLVGFAVAAAVYGVRLAVALVAGRRSRGAVPAEVHPLLARAADAAGAIALSRRLNRDAEVAVLLSEAAAQARQATQRLERRALAMSTVDRMAAGMVAGMVAGMAAGTDRRRLADEHQRLTREAGELPEGPLRTEKLAAAQAAGSLVDSHQRLADIRARLLASVESTVLRLEATAAQGSVLVSMGSARGDGDPAGEPDGDPDGDPGGGLARLADEIEAVRSTLEQTEEITRELLGPANRSTGR